MYTHLSGVDTNHASFSCSPGIPFLHIPTGRIPVRLLRQGIASKFLIPYVLFRMTDLRWGVLLMKDRSGSFGRGAFLVLEPSN